MRSNYARYHLNINIKKKKKQLSIETQNIVKEVSVTTTKFDENCIELSIIQTHLYSATILILQI